MLSTEGVSGGRVVKGIVYHVTGRRILSLVSFIHRRAKREDSQLPPLPLEGATAPESSEQSQLFYSLVSKPCMGSLFVTEMYMCYKQTDRHRRQYS